MRTNNIPSCLRLSKRCTALYQTVVSGNAHLYQRIPCRQIPRFLLISTPFVSNSLYLKVNSLVPENLQGQTSVPGVCSYGFIPLSYLGNIVMRTETTKTENLF